MLDLASARRALWTYASPVSYAPATVTDIGEFDFKLMQVVERFFTLGTWRNMWRKVDLCIYDNKLTLPRGLDTCRQVGICGGGAAPIYSQFHRMAAFGVPFDPVYLGQGGNGWITGLRLVSENAQTFITPIGTYYLRATATEVNATGLTLIGGFDQDGNELFGEITLATVNGAATTTQAYTSLPLIQKAVTASPVLLYAVDTTTAVATLIASYAPGEVIPNYRQYSAAGFVSDANHDGIADNPVVVSVIGKLGFVPAVSDRDIILPGNLGALKLGLQSLGFEDKVDPANAKIYMGNAVALLDAELNELQAAEQPVFSVSETFGCGGIPNVR